MSPRRQGGSVAAGEGFTGEAGKHLRQRCGGRAYPGGGYPIERSLPEARRFGLADVVTSGDGEAVHPADDDLGIAESRGDTGVAIEQPTADAALNVIGERRGRHIVEGGGKVRQEVEVRRVGHAVVCEVLEDAQRQVRVFDHSVGSPIAGAYGGEYVTAPTI